MAEWLKAAASKAVVRFFRTGGSNPPLSAIHFFPNQLIQLVFRNPPFVRACRAIRDREDSLNLLNEHLICAQLGDILCCEMFGPDRAISAI